MKTSVAQPSLAAGSSGSSARRSEAPLGFGEQGCSPHPQAGKPALPPHGERGVALVVTLILLTVITFLAVAFLFLSRRERGAVTTAVDMTMARLAAEAATEQAKAEALARMIATGDRFNYGLLVSTNFVSAGGFISGNTSLTNVNYDFAGGNLGNQQQNIANLYYSPRPPVFVNTNRNGTAGPLDFRFWLDLNRNRLFDTNGVLAELNFNGAPITAPDTNNNQVIVSNRFVGDPEWIGILEKPGQPHGPDNRFVARMAFILVPEGLTLDINTMHNQTKRLGVAQDGFMRNMGVAPFEFNWGAGLVDLNTNIWNSSAPYYFYDTNFAIPSQGLAFSDAAWLTHYRYNGNYDNLRTVGTLFGVAGANAFLGDLADGYAAGPLMAGTLLPDLDADAPNRVNLSWPGADSPNHFFTTQDFFDRNKTGPGQAVTFTDRLIAAGRNSQSTYDRYTFYRMLSQLGTDSGPEPAKMHLNYKNVVNGQVVPNGQTNFVSWEPLDFFTNAADRMLRANFGNRGNNLREFGVNDVLSITNLPVMVSNTMVYSPALHRILQVAANIFDSSTNYSALRGGANSLNGDLPSVFRPRFETRTNGAFADIYIRDWVEVGVPTAADMSAPLDLQESAGLQAVQSAPVFNGNLFGVPWVIGAKKGFPNFNEFAFETLSQFTRKLQLVKPTINSTTISATNQMFLLGVSNVFGFELWNSYATAYPRDVDVLVTNEMAIYLNFTNNRFGDLRNGVRSYPFQTLRFGVRTNINANTWQGYNNISEPNLRSFVVPMRTNVNFLPEAIYRMTLPGFVSISQSNVTSGTLLRGFETGLGFPIPEFSLAVSNRIRVMLIDRVSGRVVDYVQLNDLNSARNLTGEVSSDVSGNPTEGNTGSGAYIFWNTNRPNPNSINSAPYGVLAQIEASLGNPQYPTDWQSYGVGQADGQSRNKEIAAFQAFMGRRYPGYAVVQNDTTIIQAPFTPTRRFSQHISWQANDPLVHFMAGDLADLARSNAVTPLSTRLPIGNDDTLRNLGRLNTRFEPWGGYPVSSALDEAASPVIAPYAIEAKDPGVRTSDDWIFPTNKYATVGWLGRVHRGTPWQTIYLKSGGVDGATWARWTGNPSAIDSGRSMPTRDRLLFDMFTTAFDEDSTRGQLNVNQAGLAAWSAGLAGVIGLTNSSTDEELTLNPATVRLDPFVVDPAGVTAGDPTNSALGMIWRGINRARNSFPFNGHFRQVGDVLATPELTAQSPLLNRSTEVQRQRGIDDATYERLPQMLLSLLRGGDQPRFAIYAYGQTLKPANRSVISSGALAGLCTNYQVTAEFATRTVVQVETETNQAGELEAHAVTTSFNILPPDE